TNWHAVARAALGVDHTSSFEKEGGRISLPPSTQAASATTSPRWHRSREKRGAQLGRPSFSASGHSILPPPAMKVGFFAPPPVGARRRRRLRRRPAAARALAAASCAACCCCLSPAPAAAFAPSAGLASVGIDATTMRRPNGCAGPRPSTSTRLRNLFPKDEFDRDDFLDDDDDDAFDGEKYDPAVAAQIRKARRLLDDAKKKQRLKEEEAAEAAAAAAAADGSSSERGDAPPLPFFAARSFTASAARSALKIKSKLDDGTIVADGEAMSSLSKSEPWESRSLGQMSFTREARTDYDGNAVEGEEIDGRVTADRDVARSIYNLRKKLQNEDFKKVFDSRNRFIGDLD
ncbi:hypothetical protein ACHAWF_002753, partial [Thalassiosira exigua]